MALSSELSRKWRTEQDDDDKSCRRQLIKEGTGETRGGAAAPPDEPEEVPPPPPDEPEEVPPPLPEEALVSQPVEVVSAPALTADDASWSVNIFCEAFNRLQWVTVHLGVPGPNDLLQRTVKDYTFKIQILAGDLERGVLDPIDDDDGDDGAFDDGDDGGLDDSCSDSDGGAHPTTTTFA
jgi:hypothetical protein